MGALGSIHYASESAIHDAIIRRSCFNLIHLATNFKVDVFVVKDREYDRMALRRSRRDSLDEEDPSAEFFFASAEDVVLSKLERYRLGDEVSQQQWGDVINVLRVQEDSIDRAYVEKWAAELGVADLLGKAWNEVEM
jgi:hypothetical protein